MKLKAISKFKIRPSSSFEEPEMAPTKNGMPKFLKIGIAFYMKIKLYFNVSLYILLVQLLKLPFQVQQKQDYLLFVVLDLELSNYPSALLALVLE